jgi:hypothetical protein
MPVEMFGGIRSILRSMHHSLPVGKAVSELVRRGLSAPVKTRAVNGLVVFDVSEDGEPVTSELVERLEDEE